MSISEPAALNDANITDMSGGIKVTIHLPENVSEVIRVPLKTALSKENEIDAPYARKADDSLLAPV